MWPILFIGSAAVVYFAYRGLTRDDVLPVRKVTVNGANEERSDEIAVYASIPRGTPLFSVEPDEVSARVAEHPLVKEAIVRRVPPDAITIDVTLRTPLFIAILGEVPYLVDETGVPYGRARTLGGTDLIAVTGLKSESLERAASAIRILTLEEISKDVAELNFKKQRLTVQLRSGARAHFGAENWIAKTRLLKQALASAEERNLQLSSLYLDDDRRPERIAVRLQPFTEMGTVEEN